MSRPRGSFPFLAASAATISGFLISVSLDRYLHGGHNLLPIGFVFYFTYTEIGVSTAIATAVVGLALRGKRLGHL